MLRRKSECDAPNWLQIHAGNQPQQHHRCLECAKPWWSDRVCHVEADSLLMQMLHDMIAQSCKHACHRLSNVLFVMILRWRNFGMWLISYSGVRDLLQPGFPVNVHHFLRARRLQTGLLQTCSISCQENRNTSVPESVEGTSVESTPASQTPRLRVIRSLVTNCQQTPWARGRLTYLQGIRFIPSLSAPPCQIKDTALNKNPPT